MLLVLAVLAAMTAILYPAVDRLYRTSRFTQAMEQLRAKLSATRVRAIDDGHAYQFRFEPEGRRMVVVAFGQRSVPLERDERRFSRDQPSDESWYYFAELPQGLQFQSAAATGQRLSPQQLRALPEARELTAVRWSTPVLFFPDGSSHDAAIRVTDGSGRSILLSVRGLTGAATTSRIQREARR